LLIFNIQNKNSHQRFKILYFNVLNSVDSIEFETLDVFVFVICIPKIKKKTKILWKNGSCSGKNFLQQETKYFNQVFKFALKIKG